MSLPGTNKKESPDNAGTSCTVTLPDRSISKISPSRAGFSHHSPVSRFSRARTSAAAASGPETIAEEGQHRQDIAGRIYKSNSQADALLNEQEILKTVSNDLIWNCPFHGQATNRKCWETMKPNIERQIRKGWMIR